MPDYGHQIWKKFSQMSFPIREVTVLVTHPLHPQKKKKLPAPIRTKFRTILSWLCFFCQKYVTTYVKVHWFTKHLRHWTSGIIWVVFHKLEVEQYRSPWAGWIGSYTLRDCIVPHCLPDLWCMYMYYLIVTTPSLCFSSQSALMWAIWQDVGQVVPLRNIIPTMGWKTPV